MSLRHRLSARMLEAGVVVSPDAFRPATGHYRTSPYADAYRWEAYGSRNGGPPVLFASYDTMEACARNGVVVDATGEVHARSKPESKPRYEVRRVSRGFWTYDLYLLGVELISVGEVHGDEREARRRAQRALEDEIRLRSAR